MREIVEPVDLCDGSGRLSERAIGWSRRPMHRCNLERRWRKRWDWWSVTDERWFLLLCVADLDYLAFGAVSLLDTQTGKLYERIIPLSSPLTEMPGELHFHRLGMRIDVTATRISASVGKLRADFDVEPPRDTLNVVVPWSPSRFWFTSKQIGLPAKGRVEYDGRTIEIDGWAAMDFGRGRWPARAKWNWGVGVGGNLAFNLGARWTDGTGATENGLFVDGRLIKLHEPVSFDARFSIRSSEVQLDFQPAFTRKVGWPPMFGLHWCTGHFNGSIRDQEINRMFGWAEALDILW